MIITPRLAEYFLFVPSRVDPGPAPVVASVRGEDVSLEAVDGVRLHAWWFEAGEAAPAVLLFHGNAGTIADRTPLARAYLENGISILLLSYRGYGRSGGSPSLEGVAHDGAAALDWLVGRLGDPGRIVLHGRSLGGAVAVRVGSDRQVAGVILESTFTTLEEIARAVYPFLPSFLFRRLEGHADALEAVRRVRAPVLVVHGTADRLIPVRMGRALVEAAGNGALWYEVAGAGHNDMWIVGGADYFDRLARFVTEVTSRRTEGPGAGSG